MQHKLKNVKNVLLGIGLKMITLVVRQHLLDVELGNQMLQQKLVTLAALIIGKKATEHVF